MKNKEGITLISLVITIIILVILSAVVIYLTLGDNGILNKAEQAKNETVKQTATEKMNLKITNMQIEKYTEEQRMPTLQEFADGLCEDDEIQYVQLQSKKVGSLSKIEVGEAESIFTKLKEYPYEFEINSSLQLASIDGIQLATSDTVTIPKEEYDKLKNANKYSAEEIEIGTWIDGKPLYRKVITGIKSPSQKDVWKDIYVESSAEMLMVEKLLFCFSDGKMVELNYYNGAGIFYAITGNKVQSYIYTNESVYGNRDLILIVNYTKTTDSAS